MIFQSQPNDFSFAAEWNEAWLKDSWNILQLVTSMLWETYSVSWRMKDLFAKFLCRENGLACKSINILFDYLLFHVLWKTKIYVALFAYTKQACMTFPERLFRGVKLKRCESYTLFLSLSKLESTSWNRYNLLINIILIGIVLCIH